tara:strand:+ start:254 stop:457 length:204 start_codon:yes stop_codon:yes gene_type:complete
MDLKGIKRWVFNLRRQADLAQWNWILCWGNLNQAKEMALEQSIMQMEELKKDFIKMVFIKIVNNDAV